MPHERKIVAEPKKSEEREEEKKDAQTEERSEKREERHAHEDEKKDSKREEHGKRSSSKKRDHESRVEKRAKAESDNEIHAWTDGIPLSPVWWAPVFTTLMIVGLLWIVVFYISGATYPIPKIG
ncbi:MAG: cell division protein CrgA, partial [Trueperella pyogenes]|nr:cell division protein CrgA [Trueperella pyogenes]